MTDDGLNRSNIVMAIFNKKKIRTEEDKKIEQMKHLKELGPDTSDASMCFEWNGSDPDNMVVTSPDADTNYDLHLAGYSR